MIDWTPVLVAVGINGCALGAVAWLLKTLVSNRLTRENEALRAELALKSQQAVTRFEKLHEKRAEVLGVIYGHLSGIEMVFGSLPGTDQSVNTDDFRRKIDWILAEMIRAAIYFRRNALYFDLALKEKLEKYVLGIFAFSGMVTVINDSIEGAKTMTEEQKKEARDMLLPAVFDARKHTGPLLAEVEQEFRKLLQG
jgi:hypothetical protein